MNSNPPITVEVTVEKPIGVVWKVLTTPEHIIHWNHASDDWHTPSAVNDVRVGGNFNYQMAAKDGSVQFDFMGTYTEVILEQHLAYMLGDGRVVEISLTEDGDTTLLTETFDPESENSHELQRSGWQAILDNLKTYAESI
jgi:uncharacterized protein YndB with AHSA1/START domain